MQTNNTKGTSQLPTPPLSNDQAQTLNETSPTPGLKSDPLAPPSINKTIDQRVTTPSTAGRKNTEDWFGIHSTIPKAEEARLLKIAVDNKRQLNELQCKHINPKDTRQHKQECDALAISICSALICAGLIHKTQPHLNKVRLGVTVNSSNEILGNMHYDYFLLHHAQGDYTRAIESLRLSSENNYLTASWESVLINLGLVEGYQIFCDPDMARKTLLTLKKNLAPSHRANQIQTIYTDESDIGDLLQQHCRFLLPLMENPSQLPEALDLLDDIHSSLKSAINEENDLSAEFLKTKAVIFQFIDYLVKSTIELKLWNTKAPKLIDELTHEWRKGTNNRSFMDAVDKVVCTLPEDQKDPFRQALISTTPNLWHVFLSLPKPLQTPILNLATAIDTAKEQGNSSNEATNYLSELYKKSSTDPQIKRLLTIMLNSTTEVYLARDCLRSLVGIDLPKNTDNALLYAQCLSLRNPARGGFLTALCLREIPGKGKDEIIASLTQSANAFPHPSSMLMLADFHHENGNTQEALIWYLKAGEAGAATGYRKAGETLLPKADQQIPLWGVAAAYYQQAAHLLCSHGLDSEEQHCLVMAEYCESIMDSLVKTTEAKKTNTKPEAAKTVSTQDLQADSEPPLQPSEAIAAAPEDADSPTKKEPLPVTAPLQPPASSSTSHQGNQTPSRRHQSKRKKARPQPTQPARPQKTPKSADAFWAEMKSANQLIESLDFDEAEKKLTQLAKIFSDNPFFSRIEQMKAWICKMKIDHRGLAKVVKSNNELIEKGWEHITAGVWALTKTTISRNNHSQLNFDTSSLTAGGKRNLASLLSTAAHLLNLDANPSTSERLIQMRRDLYHEANTINPGRLKRKIETTSHSGSGIQVVNAETFEIMKAAIKG